jgi:hypothetical protein
VEKTYLEIRVTHHDATVALKTGRGEALNDEIKYPFHMDI